MPRVWVSIGSNQDRKHSIRGAVRALRERYGRVMVSRVYESEAVGFEGHPFYNLVIGFDTEDEVGELNALFRGIEDAFGRVRGREKFAPRTLDIDLLTYGDEVGTIEGTELPRDEILHYAFVLGPLAEVAPDEVHPALGRTFGELWDSFKAQGQPLAPVDLSFA
ncbi:MAG: 2-amino-4-hydroxy-6-hydroxymethyldihydropteridine diphosphokinase [Chromatiaceae bacterium]